jgi:hypothetical protein
MRLTDTPHTATVCCVTCTYLTSLLTSSHVHWDPGRPLLELGQACSC